MKGAKRGSIPSDSDLSHPGLLRGSTLRSAVLVALAVWAPGAIIVSLHHRDWTRHLLAEAAVDLEELTEESLEIAHQHRIEQLEDQLGEPLGYLEALDDETPDAFFTRYVERIREAQRSREDQPARPETDGLHLRLALLGAADQDALSLAPIEALLEMMEEEVPEAFHETLEDLRESLFEAQDGEYRDAEISAEELAAAIEGSESIEELDACILREDATGQLVLASSNRALKATEIGQRFTVVRVAGHANVARRVGGGFLDAGELEPWCLIERRLRPAGSRLLIGTRVDERYGLIRRSALKRNLLLALGLPLALAAGWLQSRPIARFLAALGTTANRQEDGEVGARLQLAPDDRDLAFAVDTINRMLARLEQTVQGLSRVSDSIAHDLRTPLSRLQGQLDLLKQSPDPGGELIEAVQEEADQLLQTFNALLRIAQVESGSKKQGFRQIDLAGIAHDVAELYAPVFAEKGIAFTIAVPRSRVGYHGDRDLWLQALSNLVENALKYTPEGGRVDLKLDDQQTRPRIRLADSGPGIPEHERENVFRRFYRLQRHRGERGNGLGLSLVGAVCDLHGAQIRLSGDRGLIVDIEL